MDPADEGPHPDNNGWLLCFAHLPVLACFDSDFTITLLGTIVSPAWVLTKCGFGLSGNPEVSSADVAMVLAYGPEREPGRLLHVYVEDDFRALYHWIPLEH